MNQSYTVAPAEAATNTASTAAPSDNQNRGARTYTVQTGNATAVRIELIPCDEVDADQDGIVTFGDNEGTANEADDLGDTLGRIEVVNGVATDGSDSQTATPQNGQVTFTVDSETANICVVPVVYQDTDNDGDLDLTVPTTANTNPKTASEPFGIGGDKTFVLAEAVSGGVVGDEDITFVDKAGDFFSTATGTYYYDANDTFQIENFGGGTGCIQVSQAVFEQNLSVGDDLEDSSSYNADPQFVSVLCLVDTDPAAPANTNATAVDNDTITVVWDPVANADSYNVYRALDTDQTDQLPDCPAAANAAYTKVGSVPTGTTTFTDNGLTGETEYCYRVTAVDDGDESDQSNADMAETTTGPETTRPLSTDAEQTTSGGFANRLDAGDVLKACFDETLRTPDAGDAVELLDDDGDVTTLVNGQNATFTLGTATTTDVGNNTDVLPESCAANQTLVITVTGAVADQNANAGAQNGVVNVPVTATDSNGVTDLAGNEWDIVNSDDDYFDLNAGDDVE